MEESNYHVVLKRTVPFSRTVPSWSSRVSVEVALLNFGVVSPPWTSQTVQIVIVLRVRLVVSLAQEVHGSILHQISVAKQI